MPEFPPAGGIDLEGATRQVLDAWRSCGMPIDGKYTVEPDGDCWVFTVRLHRGTPMMTLSDAKAHTARTGEVVPCDELLKIRVCDILDPWGTNVWQVSASVIDVATTEYRAMSISGPTQEEWSQIVGHPESWSKSGEKSELQKKLEDPKVKERIQEKIPGSIEEAARQAVCPLVSEGGIVTPELPPPATVPQPAKKPPVAAIVAGIVAAGLLGFGVFALGGDDEQPTPEGSPAVSAPSPDDTAMPSPETTAAPPAGPEVHVKGEMSAGTYQGSGSLSCIFDLKGLPPGKTTVDVDVIGENAIDPPLLEPGETAYNDEVLKESYIAKDSVALSQVLDKPGSEYSCVLVGVETKEGPAQLRGETTLTASV